MMHDFREDGHKVAEQFGLAPDVVWKTRNSWNQINDIWAKRARSVNHTGRMGAPQELAA
jgi:hypothetical protein